MKAIETRYKGYRFRSRTEARWAVFFEVLGLRWDYEDEGYVLSDGTWYLPDFKLILDDRLVYCEVKKEEFDDFSDEELAKLRLLSNGLNSRVILLTGIPEYRAYQQIFPNTEKNVLSLAYFQDYQPFVQTVDQYWLQYLRFDELTGRMYFDMDERRLRKAFGRKYLEAIESARSARFEHGESP